jgi:hypothetical protein
MSLSPCFDSLETRLRTRLGALIVMRERPWNGAPEQVGRRSNEAMGGQLIGHADDVGIDPVHGASQHNGGKLLARSGHCDIAIEFTALAGTDPYALARHAAPPVRYGCHGVFQQAYHIELDATRLLPLVTCVRGSLHSAHRRRRRPPCLRALPGRHGPRLLLC